MKNSLLVPWVVMLLVVGVEAAVPDGSTQEADAGAAGPVARSIFNSGHRRVAVVPAVISRRGDVESSSGQLGARSTLLVRGFQQDLESVSKQKRFEVVSDSEVRAKIQSLGFTIQDLKDPQKLQQLSMAVNASVLVTLSHDETRRTSASSTRDDNFDFVNVTTIDPLDNFRAFSQEFADGKTLAKAAYGGQSWELRRWQANTITNVGFDLDGNGAFGQGIKWESVQYSKLKTDLPHPIDVSDCPYRISIVVDKAVRKPRPIHGVHGKQYVVELNPGEVYKIWTENKSEKPVYVALYVDGVSTVDKVRAEPEDLETHRHWKLDPKTGTFINGWYLIERDKNLSPLGTPTVQEFVIRDKKDSVAASLGGDAFGMITAVFYTVGMEGIPVADEKDLPPPSKDLAPAMFATGEGHRKVEKLTFAVAAPRGIILGAQTIYYRTKDQLDAMQTDKSNVDFALTPIR